MALRVWLCSALVGQLGTAPLAGVGVSTMPVIFGSVIFNFLLFVTTPAVARAVAKKDFEEVRLSINAVFHMLT